MSDTVKIGLYVGTGYAGCNYEDSVEVDKAWWESLTEHEQEKELDEMAQEFLWNKIECSAWVEEGE